MLSKSWGMLETFHYFRFLTLSGRSEHFEKITFLMFFLYNRLRWYDMTKVSELLGMRLFKSHGTCIHQSFIKLRYCIILFFFGEHHCR